MAGAIAGTALVNFASELTDRLSTVTLTVNNLCNLSCPHCYLQYEDGSKKYISDDILKHLYQANFKHLVIVGKEPLVNNHTVEIVQKIIDTVKAQQRTIGIITNGFGLEKLTSKMLGQLSYVDISLDGGPNTYADYRGGDFDNIISKVRYINEHHDFKRFNVLNVINDKTLGYLEDMLDVRSYFSFEHMMFSPYIETLNDGVNTVQKISIEKILETFAKSAAFLKDSKAFILLDTYHLLGELTQPGLYSEFREMPNAASIQQMISFFEMENKVKLIERDPILHGFVRLTYDGYVLSPYASLNPTEYKLYGDRIENISLENFFINRTRSLLN